ncbi:MAG: hypothetical protein AB7E72_06370 [Lysobacterales bacterium]
MCSYRYLFCCLLGFVTAAHADVFTVGSGAACTHASIQDAITAGLANGTGLDVINVARNRSYTAQALVAQNDTLVIQGGFADCSSATGDPNNPTVLSGAGGAAAPVLRIQGSGNVTLRNLVLQGGDAPANADGGGLAIVDGPHQITLNNVQLASNHAGRGAGMAVTTGVSTISVTFQGDSRIFGNQASSDGGGIYCRSASLSLVTESLIINSNTSARDGGGIYAENCSIDLASGHALGALWNNQATRNGGGMYVLGAFGGARIYSLFVDALTRLNGNNAAVGGGAIYATDGARVQLQNVEVVDNVAQDGGAILMRGTGNSITNDLTIVASNLTPAAVTCPNGRICNRFVNNRSSVAGVLSNGAAAIAYRLENGSAGRAHIQRTSFEGNQGGRVIHSFIPSAGAFNEMALSNVALFGNQQSDPQGALIYGQKLTLNFVSIAGNTLAGSAVIRGFDLQTVLGYVAAFQPGKPLLQQTGGSVLSGYLIANDLSGIPPTVNNLEADPLFVSASDLHLRPGSLAIDYATSSSALAPPYNTDILGNPRPVDDSQVPNAFGPIDVGAYESEADALFANGFEPCFSC